MPILSELLPELFTRSQAIILDFNQISSNTPSYQNIQEYFKSAQANNMNPRLPENRQKFNDNMIQNSKARYLIGRYGEDRIAMLADTPAGKQGRTIHMAIDIFSQNLEPVYAPCDGEIIRSDYEEGFGEYGHYLIFKPANEEYYIFLGHLAADRVGLGQVKGGELLAHLGDYYNNENGGWSRHLHLQLAKKMPIEGKTPDGYSTKEDFEKNALLYPSPMNYFPEWRVV